MRLRTVLAVALLAAAPAVAQEEAPQPAPKPAARTLPPLRTATAEQTFKTFMAAMNDYREGVETHDVWLQGRIDDAIVCLDLSNLEGEARRYRGETAARFLKEIIDRLGTFETLRPPNVPTGRWRLAETIITLMPVEGGERSGEFLFTKLTVEQAPRLYEQVYDLPYVPSSGQGALVRRKESASQGAASPALAPLKTDTPRDTMRTFMTAMNDYRDGRMRKDETLAMRIFDAVYCLDLSALPNLVRENSGREAAVFLKEVIDRIVAVDYSRIPERGPDGEAILRWRLKDSSISISRIEEGDRRGEYLFAAATVGQAKAFYQKIQHLPYVDGSGQGAVYTVPWIEKHSPAWALDTIVLLHNWQWIGMFLAICCGFFLRGVIRWILSLLKSLTTRSSTEWDEKLVAAIEAPLSLVAAAGFWWVALQALHIEGAPLTVLSIAVEMVFSVAVIWTAYRIAGVFSQYLTEVAGKTDNTLDDHLVPLIQRALRTFIIVFGVLIMFQNLGFNVMSVLAGLGLGGLAFALAAQDTCANLFGSLMILVDRPFLVGDWIIASGVEGTVEEIGFRSTRVRTFYNSVISVPNASLASSNIDNMGRRKRRRIKTVFDLTYDTPPEKIEAFVEGLKNIVKANNSTVKDYFQVSFNGYGASGLQVLLYCFLEVPNWSAELIEKQNIYLEVLRLAQELGVEFAFPTQTLHMETFPEKAPTRAQNGIKRDQLVALAKSFGPDGENSMPHGQGMFLPPSKDPDLVAISRGDSGHNDDDGG